MNQHVAVYARISKDRLGQAVGVGRQEKDGRALAANLWPGVPVEVYVDNDITAGDPNVERPDWRRLLRALRAGEVAGIVTYEQSRLTRQPIEWEEFIVACSHAGIATVATVNKGEVSVASENRLVGRVVAAVDADELERIRIRTTRTHKAIAKEGRPSGGRIFGYAVGRDEHGRAARVVIPSEADVVREAAARVIRGEPMTQVAADFRARGIPTVRGGRWSVQHIRSIVSSPAVAGLRAHYGEVTGPATWAAILDEPTWQAVRRVLGEVRIVIDRNGQERRVPRSRRLARRYLLTGGLARCGLCDSPLVGQIRDNNAQKVRHPIYACHPNTGPAACSKIVIRALPLEAYVGDFVLEDLRSARFNRLRQSEQGEEERLMHELAENEAFLLELARAYGAREMTKAEFDAARELPAAKASALRERLEVAVPAELVDWTDPAQLAAQWEADELTLSARRAIVGQLLEAVRVLPATLGRRGFDEERVDFVWRV